MKKTRFFITILLVTLTASITFAQKLKVESGEFDFLKDQKEINVKFNYDGLKLYKDNISEEEYVAKNVKEKNEKSPGKGDGWKKEWYNAREVTYAPKFLELMNRYLYKEKGIKFQENLPDTKYTLLVNVMWMYPGWNAAVMRQPSKLTTVLQFVETTNPENIVLEISSKNAPGNKFGGTFSDADRMGESFAKTGKSLGKLLLKNAF